MSDISSAAAGITPARPTPFLDRKITVDLKGLFKALGKSFAHLKTGKLDDLIPDAVEAITSFGLEERSVEELAWLLIRRAMVQAVISLVQQPLISNQVTAATIEPNARLTAAFDAALEASLKDEIFISRDFLVHPDRLRFVTVVQSPLKSWLLLQGIDEAAAASIVNRLPSFFTYALAAEWRKRSADYQPLHEALNNPFGAAADRQWAWTTYSRFLQRRVDEGMMGEPFSLRDVYVPLRAAFALKDPNAGNADELSTMPPRNRQQEVVELSTELKKWLSNETDDWIRVISGGPGSGKSSSARIFAADQAQQGDWRVLFVPLHLLALTDDLRQAVGAFTASEGILPHNPLDARDGDNKLLLIFDGLDELAKQGTIASSVAQQFIQEVKNTVLFCNQAPGRRILKVLIIGREVTVQTQASEFRQDRQVLTVLPYFVREQQRAAYTDPRHLLAVDQRIQWWMLYHSSIGQAGKGLPDQIKSENLEEVTAQPLLNYLVALSLRRGKLDITKDTNLNEIYNDLLSSVYERAYERDYATGGRVFKPIAELSQAEFNRLLEEVALAVWHEAADGVGRATSAKTIEQYCTAANLTAYLEKLKKRSEGVMGLLAAFYFRRSGDVNGIEGGFEFTHKSFGEYLVARRIVRAVLQVNKRMNEVDADDQWDNKTSLQEWLRIFGPTEIDDDLFVFILRELDVYSRVAPAQASRLVEVQNSLTRLVSYLAWSGMPIDRLPNSGSFPDIERKVHNAQRSLIGIWLAIPRFSKTLISVDNDHLSRICEFARDLSYSCYMPILGEFFRAVDVRNRTIAIWYGSKVNAAEVDFTNARIVSGGMWAGDFRRARLTNAKFQHITFTSYWPYNSIDRKQQMPLIGPRRRNQAVPIFEECSACDVLFEQCDIAGADFRNCDLRGANFLGCDLRFADFTGSDVSGASFKDSDVTGAIFSGLDLTTVTGLPAELLPRA